jgi:hypothetical protein
MQSTKNFTPIATYPDCSRELQWAIRLLLIEMKAVPYLCEQDTEKLIHRIEEAMQNLIPLSVSDVLDLTLQLRSERFHTGIGILRKAKCYQQIKSLTCKGIAEPCRSWVNWFAGQHQLKLKSASPIAENCLIAGTKLKIEQFFKTFEDFNQSFRPN